MISTPEFLYMAESEGKTDLVSTRTAKMNAVISRLREIKSHCFLGFDPDEWVFNVCDSFDFEPTTLELNCIYSQI